MSGRLRRSDCTGPGISRRRSGRGFSYRSQDGRAVDAATRARIAALAIPPAWTDVWICHDELGHLQATGIDARGRKQYLYHQRWRERRDREKFEAMVRFGAALPELRAAVTLDLAAAEPTRERVLACAVRLLDLGFFRVGGEGYASENESYGLATLRKEHVRVDGDRVIFDYPAKHGIRRHHAIRDQDVAQLAGLLRRRRGGGDELLAYKQRGRWIDVRSDDVNEYLKRRAGDEVSAKLFRTWQGTVLAALALAVAAPASRTVSANKRAKLRAVREVAHYLGNTPAVARAAYVDPRVFDRFDAGVTIAGALHDLPHEPGLPATHGAVEQAVLDLLQGDFSSAAIERTAA